MAARTKVINFFSSRRKAFRYKFPYDELANVIDNRIRYELSLSIDTKYSLIDLRDSSIIEISTLRYLDDGSIVFVRMRDEENLKLKSFIGIE